MAKEIIDGKTRRVLDRADILALEDYEANESRLPKIPRTVDDGYYDGLLGVTGSKQQTARKGGSGGTLVLIVFVLVVIGICAAMVMEAAVTKGWL